MSAARITQIDAGIAMRSSIQRIATGPEHSKDLSFDEARAAMEYILQGKVDPVQAGVFLIALRMKRETDDENRGVLQAILDATETVVVPVDELTDVADPYDGYTRGLPASPFIPPVLAACDVPTVSHGLESVGPKYGVTHRKVLRAAGIDVDLSPTDAAARIANANIGWAYVDQKAFCPRLHDLVNLRGLIVKRPAVTTVEVMAGPIRGRKKTHLMTGYVHKSYPRMYAMLARHAGFDSALIVRGVEGGVVPSLQQPAKVFYYHDEGEVQQILVEPTSIGISQSKRAIPIPDDLPKIKNKGDTIATTVDPDAIAKAAAEAGIAALEGKGGPAYDSLVYAAAICLLHLKRHDSLQAAADAVHKALDSGEPLARFRAQ
jgi:anthranilate phosphoribosyltransferase